MKRLAFILAAVALAGCSSVQICREGGHDMCCVRTSGWKLFNCIPFVSGNPEGWCCRFFSDTVKVETNIALLDKTIRDGDRTTSRCCRSSSSASSATPAPN